MVYDSQDRANDEVIAAAARAYWATLVQFFPEMTSGDSQITDEDEAAMATWRNGVCGDRSEMGFELFSLEHVEGDRVEAAVAASINAAGAVLFADGPAPEAPDSVRKQLMACATHLLYYNYPSRIDNADDNDEAHVPAVHFNR